MTPAGAAPGSGWALFLDFDGTLVDIAPRPEAVVVPPDLPALLAALRDGLGGALAIVTGRALADIDGFFPGLDLDGCGMHGLERRAAGRTTRPDLPLLGTEVATLRRDFAGHPGVVVEDKAIGVALHWRLAPDAEGAAREAMSALAARLGPAYRLQDGKAVREIVPAGAGKGHGIRALLAGSPYAGRRPIFLGDDRTDEDGFAAVESAGGMSVKVGAGATGASRRLPSPDAVRAWLGHVLVTADPTLALDRA